MKGKNRVLPAAGAMRWGSRLHGLRIGAATRRDVLAAGLGAAAGWTLGPLAWAQASRVAADLPGDPAAWTLAQAAAALGEGAVSPVELTQACLARIERLDPVLNSYITVRAEEALAESREAQAEIQAGRRRGPLHGVPIALKDNIDTAGTRTTAASGVFQDRMPEEDAHVVALLKEAGAIVLGKLNLHEFALGGTSAVSHFGPVRNPWELDHNPGGSSGGSGAAVAADLCLGALGTDTGGSVRIPASCCGIVGLKPTYGLVSNRGVIPMAWTLDHVGPMCKTVEDAAMLLTVLAGYDERDPTTIDAPVADYAAAVGAPVSTLRLGIPTAGFFENLDPEVDAALHAALDVLGQLGAEVREVDVPEAGPVGVVWNPEIYAYHEPWITTVPELYQDATRGFIQRAADTSSTAYAQARRRVDLVRLEIRRVFAEVDLLITPTRREPPGLVAPPATPGAAPPPAAGGGGSLNNTAAFNIYGLPTISVPCGFTSAGLPIGMQISGAHFAEPAVIALAHAYEQATEWHRRRPDVTQGEGT